MHAQADVRYVSEMALAAACDILAVTGPRLDGDLALHWDPENPEARARSRRRMDQHMSRLWLYADIRTAGLSEDIQDMLHVRTWSASTRCRAPCSAAELLAEQHLPGAMSELQ